MAFHNGGAVVAGIYRIQIDNLCHCGTVYRRIRRASDRGRRQVFYPDLLRAGSRVAHHVGHAVSAGERVAIAADLVRKQFAGKTGLDRAAAVVAGGCGARICRWYLSGATDGQVGRTADAGRLRVGHFDALGAGTGLAAGIRGQVRTGQQIPAAAEVEVHDIAGMRFYGYATTIVRHDHGIKIDCQSRIGTADRDRGRARQGRRYFVFHFDILRTGRGIAAGIGHLVRTHFAVAVQAGLIQRHLACKGFCHAAPAIILRHYRTDIDVGQLLVAGDRNIRRAAQLRLFLILHRDLLGARSCIAATIGSQVGTSNQVATWTGLVGNKIAYMRHPYRAPAGIGILQGRRIGRWHFAGTGNGDIRRAGKSGDSIVVYLDALHANGRIATNIHSLELAEQHEPVGAGLLGDHVLPVILDHIPPAIVRHSYGAQVGRRHFVGAGEG